jgi:hypothetical protein
LERPFANFDPGLDKGVGYGNVALSE